MAGRQNALFGAEPIPGTQPQNPLLQLPTQADAWSFNAPVLADAARAAQTPEFWQGAAGQYGNALLMGTTAPGFRAFHGSPHSFERFDASKIGTGEGAQVYGHGLYVAGNEGAAQTYKPGGGHMYEVNVRADPANFLDWDKPLAEQPPAVRDVLTPYVQEAIGRSHDPKLDPGQVAGGRAYQAAASALMSKTGRFSEADVSAALHEAGVAGIRYLDQGSRAAGEGTSNHVIFDANTIDILRKYGIAGLMAGGAAAGAQQ